MHLSENRYSTDSIVDNLNVNTVMGVLFSLLSARKSIIGKNKIFKV